MWSALIRCAGEPPFTLELDTLPQDTTMERDVFSFWCVLLESVWSDVVVLLLKGFSRITIGGGVRLASLEERESADDIRLPSPGTAARMKTALERSPSMNKSLPARFCEDPVVPTPRSPSFVINRSFLCRRISQYQTCQQRSQSSIYYPIASLML